MQFGKLAKFVEKLAQERGVLKSKFETRKIKEDSTYGVKHEQLETYFKDQEDEQTESHMRFNKEVL